MNIKIVYETQNGTTQYVAEVIQSQLQAAGNQVTLHSVKYDGPNPSLEGVDMVLFGGPTYDDGLLEKTLRDFIKDYKPALANMKVAVFGLGNKTYPQFCVAATILEDWVKSCGGVPLTEALRLDGFPDHMEKITDYVQRLLKASD